MPRRDRRREIARAVARLNAEDLEPAGDLAAFLALPPSRVVRWVIQGERGVFLDGVHRPGVGWLSSVPACVRFCRQLAARDEGERENLEELARRGIAVGDAAAGRRKVG
jgi:hypothetical protein